MLRSYLAEHKPPGNITPTPKMIETKTIFSGPDLRGSDRGGGPRGLHETEIDSTDFIETFASLK
jgi:hypothetical protein